VRGTKKRLASLVLLLLIVVGIFGSFGGISRGAFAFMVFPAILFLFFTSRRNSLSKRLFIGFSFISLIVGCVLIVIVNIARNFAFADANWTLTDGLNLLKNLASTDFGFFEMVTNFIALSTGRIGGIRGLMAVIGSSVSDITIPVKMFIGTLSGDILQSICYSVMGFIPLTSDGFAFGIAYGMWGQLFLSKSYLVVYFGTILLVGIIICMEEAFMRKGLYSVALLISILLGMQFWGTPAMFFLARVFVLALICYFTGLYFLKKMRKMRKASPKAARAPMF